MIDFIECSKPGYPARTAENVMNSDITIAFAQDFNSAGEKLTKRLCTQNMKTYVPVELGLCEIHSSVYIANGIIDNIMTNVHRLWMPNRHVTVNIAGNGIYNLKYIQAIYNTMMFNILGYVVENFNKPISLVRSGGQTGIDEAGAIAGDRLGLNTTVLAPKGWLFRDKSGRDISDEKLFKARFL